MNTINYANPSTLLLLNWKVFQETLKDHHKRLRHHCFKKHEEKHNY